MSTAERTIIKNWGILFHDPNADVPVSIRQFGQYATKSYNETMQETVEKIKALVEGKIAEMVPQRIIRIFGEFYQDPYRADGSEARTVNVESMRKEGKEIIAVTRTSHNEKREFALPLKDEGEDIKNLLSAEKLNPTRGAYRRGYDGIDKKSYL